MNNTSQTIEDRNHGIDLLRILVTIMVVILHLIIYGGFQEYLQPRSLQYNSVCFLAIFALCAVNCFAMISGYVSYGRDFRLTNILRLHLIVLFHGILLTSVCSLIFPGAVYRNDVLSACFPVIKQTYWYYSIYAMLFFLMPLLNFIMKKLSKAQANVILFAAFILLSIFPTLLDRDYLGVNKGYSLPWLTFVYFIGTYIKKYRHNFHHKKLYLLCIYLASSLITFWGKQVADAKDAAENIFRHIVPIMDYSSPTILLSAIALILLFSDLKLPEQKVKALSFFVPLSFSVYIIHEHPLIRRLIVHDSMVSALTLPFWMQPILIILMAVFVWLVCSCLDRGRSAVFSFLGINAWLQKLEDKISRLRRHS